MARYDTFTIRVSDAERQAIASLSATLERSGSDVVRLLVREEAKRRGVWQPKVQAGGSSAGQDQRGVRG